MTVKHNDIYGYAGYVEDDRVTKWYPTRAEAQFYLNRLVNKVEKERSEWKTYIYSLGEDERRVLNLIKDLEKRKIVVRRDRKSYIDKKRLTAYKMHEGVDYQ